MDERRYADESGFDREGLYCGTCLYAQKNGSGLFCSRFREGTSRVEFYSGCHLFKRAGLTWDKEKGFVDERAQSQSSQLSESSHLLEVSPNLSVPSGDAPDHTYHPFTTPEMQPFTPSSTVTSLLRDRLMASTGLSLRQGSDSSALSARS